MKPQKEHAKSLKNKLYLPVFFMIGLIFNNVAIAASTFGIGAVNTWIDIGTVTQEFMISTTVLDLTFLNNTNFQFDDFHIRIKGTSTPTVVFLDIVTQEGSPLMPFQHNQISNTGKLVNFWAGTNAGIYPVSIDSTSKWRVRIKAKQTGTYKLEVQATTSGSPSPVPLPAAVWLFGAGFLSLLGTARHKAT